MFQSEVKYFRPREAHIEALATGMRAADRREIEAAQGHTGTAAELREYIAKSDDVYASSAEGKFLCIFGIANGGSLLSPVSSPWMLGTDACHRYRWTMLRVTRRYCAHHAMRTGELVNYVDARHHESLGFLQAAGFTIEPAAPYGVAGLPFHRFTLRPSNV